MKIFSIPGTSQVQYNQPNGDAVDMNKIDRPTPDHVCKDNGNGTGTWVLPQELETLEEIVSKNELEAKATRDAAYEENIIVDGMEFQVDKDRDMSNFDDAIFVYENEGQVGVSEIDWTLSDNSVVKVTIDTLMKVKIAKALRKQNIHKQYELWRSGDMQSPFIIK